MRFAAPNLPQPFRENDSMISRLRALFLSLMLADGATIASAQSPAVADAPSCFQLKLGEWSAPFPSQAPAYHTPPDVVRLDTVRASWSPQPGDYFRLQPNIEAIAARPRVTQPVWSRVSPDSVRLLWHSGFAGVRLDVVVEGDSLAGTATALHDIRGLPVPHSTVSGWRVACPAGLAT
jgi:hypothetical protein